MTEGQFFWAEKVAEELAAEKRKKYVCEGGWSPSGYFHIGNARPELFTPHAVFLKLREAGLKAKQILVVDDFDPIDKIPAGIPVPKEREKEFIGVPYVFAESPFKGHKTWADYFTSDVAEAVGEFGIDVKFVSAFESYKSGERDDLIKFSLDHSRQIVETWNSVAGADKPLGFLPIVIVCEQCKKTMFTEALSWGCKKVSYNCKECGYTGSVSPMGGNAKLHWRVHWVANWIVNNVAFESGGKDHFSKGGSVDVGRALMLGVFKKKPPYMIPTEFLQLKGAKMSGSKGNLFTLNDWLKVAPPELFRFLFFSYKPNTAINFSLSDNSFILLNERFERAERIYYGEEQAENEKVGAKIKEWYTISMVGGPPKSRPFRLPFSFACQLVQIMPPNERFAEIAALLKQTGHVSGSLSVSDKKSLQRQLLLADSWARVFAPPEMKISFLSALDESVKSKIMPEAKSAFRLIVAGLPKQSTLDGIQDLVFESAKQSHIPPVKLFQSLYLVLLGKESGPKVGNLILAFGKEKCSERIKEAAA
ncbi:MAG: lysine--tRNA ligase [Candidatus Diapherotrites archaeon]|nr:lysine--tRNA ligase [Candidatus Diapherotrites archaeon]